MPGNAINILACLPPSLAAAGSVAVASTIPTNASMRRVRDLTYGSSGSTTTTGISRSVRVAYSS